MVPATESTEMIVLAGGSFSLAALQLLWSLEDEGFTVAVVDGSLRVRPRARITPDVDAAIRRHRDELIALVKSCESIQ